VNPLKLELNDAETRGQCHTVSGRVLQGGTRVLVRSVQDDGAVRLGFLLVRDDVVRSQHVGGQALGVRLSTIQVFILIIISIPSPLTLSFHA